ncbi:MAG: adenylate cyclase [Gammaproteobacteria bacterium]|nr:MAG: adenylate cyclase [Gammaproteobacteria bacterium]TND04332.1 MAG: adenylate cyclase [Gammaproteobacteria bacterium]
MAAYARALYFGLFTALIGLAVAISPIGTLLESSYGLNWLFKQRGTQPAPQDVVIVALDKTSADALGLPNKPDRWPRSLHTQLIDTLHARGASVVAFDIHFREAKDPATDQAFAAAIRRAGNVVLLENVISDRQPLAGDAHVNNPLLAIEQQLPPLALFADAALATAPFPLPKVPVQVQQAWLFKAGAGNVPTLPMAAFQAYALRDYDSLRARLVSYRPDLAQRLPADSNMLRTGNRLPALMTELRSILQQDAALADQLDIDSAAPATGTETGVQRLNRSLLQRYRDTSGSRYINFYGPPRTIKTIGIHELLAGEANTRAMDLQDKAVFVGFSDGQLQEQKDAFYTVYSRDDGIDLSGVEIAATVFGNLLTDGFVERLDTPVYLALLVLWGLAAGTLARALPVTAAYPVVIALGAAYYYLSITLFGAQHLWMPLVIPLLIQVPLAVAIATLWRYRDTHRQRQAITRAFSHYLPREVVEQFTRGAQNVSPGGKEMYGVCLYTDAEQYTALSETLEPRALADLMNDYYEIVFAPIRRHGGFLSDIVGDSMLALWTAPEEQTTVRRHACLAVLEIQHALEKFNHRHRARPLPTRMGIHSGGIVLGNIGALDHFEYRAVGDTVNTSNRVQALNKTLGTRLLATGETIADIDGITTRHLGAFILPGKTRALDIHEIISPDHTAVVPRELIERFGTAIGYFRLQRWEDAERQIADILTQWPNDGPARFYQALCEQYRQLPPAGHWSGAVEIGKY